MKLTNFLGYARKAVAAFTSGQLIWSYLVLQKGSINKHDWYLQALILAGTLVVYWVGNDPKLAPVLKEVEQVAGPLLNTTVLSAGEKVIPKTAVNMQALADATVPSATS